MNPFARHRLICLTCFGLFASSLGHSAEKPAFDEASLEFFEKEVRPILINRCYECHAGGTGGEKGGLRLDSRDALLKGGDSGPAVTLDKPATSLFVSAIEYGELFQMPPKSKMPAKEIAVLSKWIGMGIPWPNESKSTAGTVKPFDLASRAAEHWCWHLVKDVSAAEVKRKDWPVNGVDRFILAKLEAKGLEPAPSAEKHALLRRVYFDLIGLPPSPDEVEEFVRDQRPNALENVVDRLLGSVHFGERWCRHWLDLTRYAETRGHEFEPIIPNAWQYRDYVIRALNADVPYDRFVTEHIAGDLIEPRWRDAPARASNPTLPINESILGTGFWFLGEEVHSPVDIRKDETDRIDNRLDVMSKTFLGLTIACARCHDHKFDAISQRDYYALAGYAISGSYRQIRLDTFEQHRQIAEQLDQLRTKSEQAAAKLLLDATRPVFEKLDLYLTASMRALDEGVSPPGVPGAGQPAATAIKAIVDRLAAENLLDVRILANWCAELNLAKDDKRHPLRCLFDLETDSPRSRIHEGAGIEPHNDSANDKERASGIVVDFGNPQGNPPIQDGVSFHLRPVERGRLVLEGTPDNPRWRVATIGGWTRDLFWQNNSLAPGTEVDNGTLGGFQSYGRMVRTPEFTLTKTRLWYLVRGSVHAYATVNSHLIIVGPLHGSLLREFKHDDDQWRWVSQGLDLYQGHRMHVEFSPVGNSPCTIAMVVQSDEAPKLAEPNWTSLTDAASASRTKAQRVANYHKAFQQAINSIAHELSATDRRSTDSRKPNSSVSEGKPQLESVGSPSVGLSLDLAFLADWIVTHEALFSPTPIDYQNSARLAAEKELAKQVQWESRLAPAMLDGNGVDEHLLVRGNSNLPKDKVARRFLEVFRDRQDKASTNESQTSVDTLAGDQSTGARLPKSAIEGGSGRLELSREILRSPLAARVAVNRIWHHLFGRGIVPTVDNLGLLGQPPTHPEFLDYLATRFVREGWSTKSMIRSLVLSRTYQMSSHPTDADSADPDNELWHRMPIKRLEGEVIRDAILTISGRLDGKAFGPSVPIHLTEFMQGRGRPGRSGPLDGDGRRSVYISVRRNFLSPMMLAFDTPSPFSTVGRRTISNVPAQALIMMNDPFVVEQAQRWADRVLAEANLASEQRLDRLYLTAFARRPTAAETSEALAFLNSQGQDRPETQREAWANLCHVLFNVKEFVFID